MSIVEPAATHKPWGEAVATVFTCLALGPPIGGAVLTLAMIILGDALGIPAGAGVGESLKSLLFFGFFSVPYSYFLGGVQAAATGIAFAAYGWLHGRPPLWFTIITALVLFGGAYALGIAEGDSEMAALFFVTHLVPTFLCWLIVRTYWRKDAL